MVVTATHPSVDESSWELAGPRWYASVIDVARARSAAAPRGAPQPSKALARACWRGAEEFAAVTELGWTVVPPSSQPQQLHADICGDDGERGGGRFYHVFWKEAAGAVCTTLVSPGRFGGDGAQPRDCDYADQRRVASRVVVIDSEILHRGAATRAGAAWSATRTAQFCSHAGYVALRCGGRCSAADLERTLPLRPTTTPREEEEDSGRETRERRGDDDSSSKSGAVVSDGGSQSFEDDQDRPRRKKLKTEAVPREASAAVAERLSTDGCAPLKDARALGRWALREPSVCVCV